MEALPWLLALCLGLTRAGDPLKELGQYVFCQEAENGTVCDAGGGRQCWGGRCLSACAALDTASEKFTQCSCGAKDAQGACQLCCSSTKQGCKHLAAITLQDSTTLSGRSKAFCMDECPWWGSGKTCSLDASTGAQGMCHRGRCRDPCGVISGNLVQCSGSGPCAQMGAAFCCMEKDGAAESCRVEDDWHFKLKKRLNKNSLASGLVPTLALLALPILSAFVA